MSADASLGAYLRRCRERSGLPVEAVSAGSRIVRRLVDALEADRQDLLPAPVYVRGFIRACRDQLELDGHGLPALRAPGPVVRDATVPGEPQP